ncbi:MAG TPA: flagellar hook-basal body complex protein [Planctomycetota bacterium]|nr:flagellar hook-basal body complex protein [Planctomycetota bacterium]
MLNGLAVSAAGGRLQAARIDIIADNLAKMTSTGYKADYAAIQAAAVDALGICMPEKLVTSPDFSEGAAVESGSKLDVAIIGNGFFEVTNGTRTYYTRNGNMHIDTDRQLATAGGLKMLNDGGQPITVSRELPIRITPDGQVMQGSTSRGRLKMVRFDDPTRQLRRENGHFAAADPTVRPEPADTQVAQGRRESSNVSSIRAMVQLIESHRVFEANMRMIRYQHQTLGKLIAQVGRIPG